MATHSPSTRFVLRPVSDRKVGVPDGAWWPETRTLSDQLGMLVALWPPEAGRIIRVLYSPPDWDDRPRSVAVGAGRRIKTGSFPRDDTQQLTVSMMNGDRRTISVIAPNTSPDTAAAALSGIAAGEVSRS
jgi:hypothetical protein